MSLIYVGIDKPAKCEDCFIQRKHKGCGYRIGDKVIEEPHNCPLKSVEGLIEAFKDEAEKAKDYYGYGSCMFSTDDIEEIIRDYCGE